MTYVTLTLPAALVDVKIAELTAIGIAEASRRQTSGGKYLITFAVPNGVGFGALLSTAAKKRSANLQLTN